MEFYFIARAFVDVHFCPTQDSTGQQSKEMNSAPSSPCFSSAEELTTDAVHTHLA